MERIEVSKQANCKSHVLAYCLAKSVLKTEQWSVSKIKPPYDIHLPALILVIYQRDKFCYFNNRNAISIMIAMQGKVIDWAHFV